MLEEVRFKAGPSPTAPPLSIRPAAITVLVGPNNCGKSVALREIEQLLVQDQKKSLSVVEGARFTSQKPGTSVLDLLRPAITAENADRITVSNPFGKHRSLDIQRTQLAHYGPHNWDGLLGIVNVARLDGPSRLSLVEDQRAEDLLAAPQNHLARLFQDDGARARLRALIFDAFGKHLVIDPTSMGTLRIRLADRPPVDPSEEQSFDQRARDFHRGARLITEFSDGARAFTGLLAAVLSLTARVLLIDEPDAFLHPPLARKLGFHIAQLANERGAHVFAATHSSEFLMGCTEGSSSVEIVRLTYTAGVATARHLPSDDVQGLMKEPLTRSANVMAALFHEGAIVTESDNDRAFYQEVNHRLLAQNANAPRRDGAAAALFLNAQNKQTVHRIIEPLRRLGVPAAAIVDIDVLKEGGKVWSNFLRGANVPEVTRAGLEAARANLAARFKQGGKDMKRDGIEALGIADREACLDLFGQLGAYGLFVVECGELERWLGHLGIGGKAPDWLISMFDRLGADPDAPGYVTPSTGDVWDFVRKVAAWLRDPRRKGMTD